MTPIGTRGGSVYTLVSAPVLGFDLARLDGGPLLAELLLVALRLDESGLDVVADAAGRLAAQAPDVRGDRAAAWLRVAEVGDAPSRARDVLAGAPSAGTPGGSESRSLPEIRAEEARQRNLARQLECAPLGTLDSLLSCIRDDLFAWSWQGSEGRRMQSEAAARALAVLCDAAAAAYLHGQLDTASCRVLRAPWETAVDALGGTYAGPLSSQTGTVHDFLRRVREADAGERKRLADAVDRWRTEEPDWASAVHDATWAVLLTSRLIAAMEAQLMLVLAVREAGWPRTGLAAGNWNALSGAVQALVVRDTLSSASTARLLGPCEEAFGALG